MQRYIVQRLLVTGLTLLGLSLVVFVFLQAVPGDTTKILVGTNAALSPQQIVEMRHRLQLDTPLPEQYLRWLGNALKGNSGNSLYTGRPVLVEIRDRLGTSIELATLALCVSLALGVASGTFSALRQGRWSDQGIRFLTVLGLAVPNFWLGTMVLVFGARWFGWVPPVQYVEFWHDPLRNLEEFVVPGLVLGVALAASLSRMARSSMLEVMREDFVRTARAKGLPFAKVVLRHAMRPSLIPTLTFFGVQAGHAVAGSVIIENVFSLPGLGRLTLDSITRKDFPTAQAILFYYGAFIVFVNFAIDLLYGALDPRIRLS